MKKQKKESFSLRTDLIFEKNTRMEPTSVEKYPSKIRVENYSKGNVQSTIISFQDVRDLNHFKKVQEVLIDVFQNYCKISSSDVILMIGLGNDKSTPDALGPTVMENILVTRHLFLLGEVEKGYHNVCSFVPNVMGNTGIDTTDMIRSIIKQTKATKVFIVDSLKTSSLSRLGKTIQITNEGIIPGSGIGSNRKEISSKEMGVEVIAIGVPTVVDLRSIDESLQSSFIVTPTDIDFLIEKLGILIGNGLNFFCHPKFRQK